jgi:sugar lactone lactonase YvrE
MHFSIIHVSSVRAKLSYLLCIILINGMYTAQAQVPVGQWRTHLPYNSANCLEVTPDEVWCGTEHGLFLYDLDDQSVQIQSRIDGMNDQNILSMRYSEEYQTMVIGYASGRIDLFRAGQYRLIDDIFRSNQIIGLKNINHIHLRGRFAYLSCSFGIVELDLEREEIRNTFVVGPGGSNLPVYGLTDDGVKFYAATDSGLLVASLGEPNLSNFTAWQFEPSLRGKALRHVAYFAGSIATLLGDSLMRYNNSIWTAIRLDTGFANTGLEARNGELQITNVFRVHSLSNDWQQRTFTFSNEDIVRPVMAIRLGSNLWMADKGGGLFRFFEGFGQRILPEGPYSDNALQLSAQNAGVLVATGGVKTTLEPLYNSEGCLVFAKEKWSGLSRYSIPGLPDSLISGDFPLVDVMQAIHDPFQNNRIYLATWGAGLIELVDGRFQMAYNPGNSSLQYIPGSIGNNGVGSVRIAGMDFDEQGNLWVTNYGVGRPVSVRRRNGTWESYSLGTATEVREIRVDVSDNKWIRMRAGGLVVLDANGTRFVSVLAAPGQGGLPSSGVNAMVSDRSGSFWIGTNEGPALFYNPNAVFRANFDAQRIKIQQEQFVGFLLGNEVITAIAVDGADRKWFGTTNGLWCFSPDGTRQIHHFTTQNSSILSNVILSLSIHPTTGEVFVGTDRGLISYRSTATEGGQVHNNVQVFPNPVEPGFEGYVSVRGLPTDAWIKITDLRGALLYQTRADGGQISWNQRTLNGELVPSGVYMVYSSTDFGEDTFASKVVVIR